MSEARNIISGGEAIKQTLEGLLRAQSNVAISVLRGKLDERQNSARRDFYSIFKKFPPKPVKAAFRALCNPHQD